MDIYEYLKKDHQKVAKLFEQFTQTEDFRYQVEIVDLITKELFIHAEAEQATFYKLLENFAETRDTILHSEKEHTQIEEKLLAIQKGEKNPNKNWVKVVLELKLIVEHHVSEEENNLFKKAKKVLSKDDAWIIKEKMHDYKDKLLQKLEKENKKILQNTEI